MINKLNAKSRLFKLLDKLDAKDKDIYNNEVLMLVKDVGDNDYYYTDDKGNKIPPKQAILDHSIKDSKGKLIPPHTINIEVVDNSYLESVLYSDI